MCVKDDSMAKESFVRPYSVVSVIALCFLVTSVATSAQSVTIPKVGDDLLLLAKSLNDKEQTSHITTVKNDWVGSEISISDTEFKSSTEDVGFRLLSCSGQPIGVSISGNKKSVLIDVEGKGKLDIELTNKIFVPCWVFDKAERDNVRGTLFQDALDNQFSMFESDEGTADGNSQFLKNYNKDLSLFSAEVDLPDRNLAYRLWFFNAYAADFPDVARYAMATCMIIYSKKYGSIHPMISQYLSEISLRLGDIDNAKFFNAAVLQAEPNFIPAKVLAARLIEDPSERQKELDKLKRQFSHHWLLKFY
jgi:hypothetical protein